MRRFRNNKPYYVIFTLSRDISEILLKCRSIPVPQSQVHLAHWHNCLKPACKDFCGATRKGCAWIYSKKLLSSMKSACTYRFKGCKIKDCIYNWHVDNEYSSALSLQKLFHPLNSVISSEKLLSQSMAAVTGERSSWWFVTLEHIEIIHTPWFDEGCFCERPLIHGHSTQRHSVAFFLLGLIGIYSLKSWTFLRYLCTKLTA